MVSIDLTPLVAVPPIVPVTVRVCPELTTIVPLEVGTVASSATLENTEMLPIVLEVSTVKVPEEAPEPIDLMVSPLTVPEDDSDPPPCSTNSAEKAEDDVRKNKTISAFKALFKKNCEGITNLLGIFLNRVVY
jgi:hypothetical protein